MRYLSILFVLFLSLLSNFAAAQCPVVSGVQLSLVSSCRAMSQHAVWFSQPNYFFVWSPKTCPVPSQKELCGATNVVCSPPTSKQSSGDGTHFCGCAAGQTVQLVNGEQKCVDSCLMGEVWDPVTSSCVGDGSASCAEEDKVFDPVTSTMVCPGTGDGGGDESCPSGYPKVDGQCPICPVYAPDGTCDDGNNPSSSPSSAQNSSTPTSSPSSSPDTGSSGSGSSTPSTGGGDDDGGDNGGSGGNGGNNGGGSNGGGSGSSSGSNTSSGSQSSWTPTSGYGNWIPVNPNSPCPNKYQDKEGQWWCWGGQSNSAASASAGSAGSASSGANSSSPYGGGGACDEEPVCPEGDIQCLQFIQQWHTRCGGEKLDSKFFDMEDQGDSEASFTKSFTNFKTELEKLPNTQHIQQFFQFNASGSCPVWQVNVWVFDVVIDQQCSADIPWDLIAGVIIAVAVLLAARIALS